MSSIKDYLDATSVPFYRDLVYLIFSIHSATFYPAETNTTYNSVPQPLHLALGLVGNASGIGPLLFTPIDLYAERQSLNETFGTSPYFRSEAQGVVQINRTFSTANGWPSLGFVLSELDKRVVIGTDTIGSVVGYDMTKDDTWFFSADALNSSVQLNFANTALVTFGNCDYPSATVVMLPTGNETGSSGPVVIDGETALTWSYAFLSDFGIPAGANSTIWNNPVGCGFSPLFVTTPAPSVDSLVAGIWSWDINMPQNGSLANCAVQQRSNGKWTIDSCSSVHPVACQSVLNPEVWVVSKTSNVWTAAATECPSGYFFSVPHTARENYALWKAFQSVPASLEATAVFLDYSSLSHQGCWVSGGPNAFCPYVDRQAIITQIIQTSFQEGIVVLVVFIIFVWFQCRNQFKNVQRRKRRAEVKWKMASEEITTIPA